MDNPKRYATLQDAIEQAVKPALDTFVDDYDVEAIARETFHYQVDSDDHGNTLLNTAGFVQVVDDVTFWRIAYKHDKTADRS